MPLYVLCPDLTAQAGCAIDSHMSLGFNPIRYAKPALLFMQIHNSQTQVVVKANLLILLFNKTMIHQD